MAPTSTVIAHLHRHVASLPRATEPCGFPVGRGHLLLSLPICKVVRSFQKHRREAMGSRPGAGPASQGILSVPSGPWQRGRRSCAGLRDRGQGGTMAAVVRPFAEEEEVEGGAVKVSGAKGGDG
mmetsp:Transcript_21868/g.49738  ORF Transcript_21868/g.49738 Transcript_21868/m.49738 type:complete len:124 (-) Transcript_21868:599-970(-)